MTRSSRARGVLVSGLLLALLGTGSARGSTPPFPLPPYCSQVVPALPDAPRSWAACPTGCERDLVVFAHGYVAPTVGPPQIPWDQLFLPDGTSIPGIVMGQGFAFATTSYRDDGLAVVEGVEDVKVLAQYVSGPRPVPLDHVYLVGASEGGLVTTLAVEQAPMSSQAASPPVARSGTSGSRSTTGATSGCSSTTTSPLRSSPT